VDTFDPKLMANFGFDNPFMQIKYSEEKGESEKIMLGKKDPIGKTTYARNSERDNIYKVETFEIEKILNLFSNSSGGK